MTEHERIEREVQEGVCEFMHVHQEIVDSVEKALPDEQQLLDLSEFFKVFGDSTRIKILYVLSRSEMCVCDITFRPSWLRAWSISANRGREKRGKDYD